MNKTELIAAVAEKAELSKKDAEKALKAFTDVIAAELVKGEKVQLVGFGTFEVSEREAREGRNPLTGEKITIAASKNPKFKAGKALKDMINAWTGGQQEVRRRWCRRKGASYAFRQISEGIPYHQAQNRGKRGVRQRPCDAER